MRASRLLPTIEHCAQGRRPVMVMSHLGRPTEGDIDEAELAGPGGRPHVPARQEVRLVKDYLDGVELADGEVVLLENVRFNKGEKKNVEDLAKKYAALCDVFVMDAFGTAHRAQASTHGVGKFAPVACAGPLLAAELDALGKALANPAAAGRHRRRLQGLDQADRARIAVREGRPVGGRRRHRQHLPQGRPGHPVGKSLCEARPDPEAKMLMAEDAKAGRHIPIAVDVVVGKEFDESTPAVLKDAWQRGRRRHDLRHRPGDRRRNSPTSSQGRHHRLERPGRRVRVRPVRRKAPRPGRGHRR
jgi:phosphoglycerate kinase